MASSELYSEKSILAAWKAYGESFASASKTTPDEPKATHNLIALYVTIGLFILLTILMVVTYFVSPSGATENTLLNSLILFGTPVLLPLIVGGITWVVLGLMFGAKIHNFRSAKQAAEKLKLQFVGKVPVANAEVNGVLPHLHDNGSYTPAAVVTLSFGGNINAVQVFGIEALQEISLITGLKGAFRCLAGVVTKAPEAKVPDLILLPSGDPQVKYFKEEVKGDTKIGSYALKNSRWGACGAGWEDKLQLLQAIEALLGERKEVCLQILSGTVSVYWHIGEPNLLRKVSANEYERDVQLALDISKLVSQKNG
jgi:uncharacterized integral membrane protein